MEFKEPSAASEAPSTRIQVAWMPIDWRAHMRIFKSFLCLLVDGDIFKIRGKNHIFKIIHVCVWTGHGDNCFSQIEANM